MSNIIKYVLTGIGTVILEWFFLSLFFTFFNGISMEAGVALGVGFFLAFEMVICTGVIVSKLEKTKTENSDETNNK